MRNKIFIFLSFVGVAAGAAFTLDKIAASLIGLEFIEDLVAAMVLALVYFFKKQYGGDQK